ncbi:MAG: sugar transporter [Flavobacteriales bacterium]|nr:MAG: sugar transporter [Flavobacteriales bacterium]
MIKKIGIVFFLVVFMSSCIPKKELTYFQGSPQATSEVYKMLNEPYRLQVNDILDINITSDNEELVAPFQQSQTSRTNTNGQINEGQFYLRGYTIDHHGNIRLPYLGEVNVLGYTEKEVREKIEEELGKFFKDSEEIFITVKLAGIRFTVLGEVANPGTLVMFQNQVNILEAIANAGDIVLTGDRKNITVVRKQLGGVKKYHINLLDMSVFNAESFYIHSNDIIYVEPLRQKSWGTGTTGVQTFTTIVSVLSFVTTTILLVKTL